MRIYMLQRLMSRAPQRARPWPVVNRELTSATTPSNLFGNNSFIVSMTQSGDAELNGHGEHFVEEAS